MRGGHCTFQSWLRIEGWITSALQELGKYGTLYVEVTFHPFVSPEKQEEMQKTLEESRRKALEVGTNASHGNLDHEEYLLFPNQHCQGSTNTV